MNSFFYFIIIIIAVFFGYVGRFLTLSGSIAAAFVGILTVLGLHIEGLFLLGLFFATSSYWSKYKKDQKDQVEERLAKGSRRDWLQVIANGGCAALTSLLYYITGEPLYVIAFCILIATSNSDTWASEIGTLSKKLPLSVRSFQLVPKGTSGAISALGTFAGIAGSALIAIASLFLFAFSIEIAFLVFLFGFFGNLLDTGLGALFQATYRCNHCSLETEKTYHCGQRTEKIRGFSLLNNDVVNLLSSLLAALLGCIVINELYYF
ncbi:hypothetical protein CHH80_03735 [Bacillus sp. 7504-2]|nr:hypothetical protein CHH80_03735 [Bacillus sp. 7504-2]